MTISQTRRPAAGAEPAQPQRPQRSAHPQPAGTPAAAASPDPQGTLVAHLLKIESEARRASSPHELDYLMANETRGLVRARQVFVLSRRRRSGMLQVRAVSSLAMVDRNVPLIRWIEALTGSLARTDGVADLREFALPAYTDATDPTTATYPFRNLLWVPLWTRDAAPVEGLLLARETPWLESDRRIAARLAETYGHASTLLQCPRRSLRPRLASGKLWFLASLGLVALGFLPVPITVLAPLEVTPREAQVVAMPVDGIVHSVLVAPNAEIKAGQPLVRLVDTVARNKLELAVREVAVAVARLEKASSLAFTDAKGRHELGIARAELALRSAERDYAREILAQTTITAAADGIAVFSDRRDLEGKPMATGDRLMQIARPGEIELRIDLPVADSIVLQTGARVRAFLDSDPLSSIAGEVSHIDYQARVSDANVAAYRVIARLTPPQRTTARLGTRGTAQLKGPDGTLALLLLRRPLSALRQWVGL